MPTLNRLCVTMNTGFAALKKTRVGLAATLMDAGPGGSAVVRIDGSASSPQRTAIARQSTADLGMMSLRRRFVRV